MVVRWRRVLRGARQVLRVARQVVPILERLPLPGPRTPAPPPVPRHEPPGAVAGGRTVSAPRFREPAPAGVDARTSTPPHPPEVSVPLPLLDAQQQAAVTAIAKSLAAHPLAPGLERWRPYLLVVLQVNAWHESRFRPDAGNTVGESSHGLFQLNQNGGVGAGHSVDELRDPFRNTTLILDELVARWNTDPERSRLQGARTVADLVTAFAALVERPGSDRHPDGSIVTGRWAVGEARAATLREWAPSVANLALPGVSTGFLGSGGTLT